MDVHVPICLDLCLALSNGEVNQEPVGIELVLPEGGYQDEGVALDVQAVLRDWVLCLNHLLDPVPPIPQLHGNLLILRPRVVEVRVPVQIEPTHFILREPWQPTGQLPVD